MSNLLSLTNHSLIILLLNPFMSLVLQKSTISCLLSLGIWLGKYSLHQLTSLFTYSRFVSVWSVINYVIIHLFWSSRSSLKIYLHWWYFFLLLVENLSLLFFCYARWDLRTQEAQCSPFSCTLDLFVFSYHWELWFRNYYENLFRNKQLHGWSCALLWADSWMLMLCCYIPHSLHTQCTLDHSLPKNQLSYWLYWHDVFKYQRAKVAMMINFICHIEVYHSFPWVYKIYNKNAFSMECKKEN